MKHVDILELVLIANVTALSVVVFTAIVLAFNNAGSKNIPLAVS